MKPRHLVLVALMLSLAGCATGPLQKPAREAQTTAAAVDLPSDAEAYAAQSAREAMLAEQPDWHLSGRAAFSNGKDSATVQIDWLQRGDQFRIELRAPITGRTWRLEGNPEHAELSGLEGGPRSSDDPESLLWEATGWTLPVRHLPAWVRGARGAAGAAALQVNAEGLPLGWEQSGWVLRFPDWMPGEPPLPRRIFAQRDGASVRVVVSEWGQAP